MRTPKASELRVGTLFRVTPVGAPGRESVRPESPHSRCLARPIVSFACATVLAFVPFGEIQAVENAPPASDKDALIHWVLERFWGNARDSTGAPIQPSSALDRHTLPVSLGTAYRIIEAGEISGLAAWCRLKWEPHYHSLTAAARARKMSDKEVAFIGVLHGAAQGITFESQTSPCTESERQTVAAKLESSKSAGLGRMVAPRPE